VVLIVPCIVPADVSNSLGYYVGTFFYVLVLLDIREFPKKYILQRWTKDVVPNCSISGVINCGVFVDGDDGVQSVIRDIIHATEYIINRLSNNMTELSLYKEHVQGYMKKTDDVRVVAPPPSKRDRLAELIGHTENNLNPIRVPIGYKSKGSGSHKRLKSKHEEAMVKAGKKERQCQNCKEYGHYASTCKKEIMNKRSTRSLRFDTMKS